jgi:hypothetical protein
MSLDPSSENLTLESSENAESQMLDTGLAGSKCQIPSTSSLLSNHSIRVTSLMEMALVHLSKSSAPLMLIVAEHVNG